jgi:hypothetical protein
MRYPKQQGTKGSLKWIRALINQFPSLLDKEICAEFNLTKRDIEWLSPLIADGFAEYRYDAFMELLGLSDHVDKLHDFWPRIGPQWDAFGLNLLKNLPSFCQKEPKMLKIFSVTIPRISVDNCGNHWKTELCRVFEG